MRKSVRLLSQLFKLWPITSVLDCQSFCFLYKEKMVLDNLSCHVIYFLTWLEFSFLLTKELFFSYLFIFLSLVNSKGCQVGTKNKKFILFVKPMKF